MSVKKSIPCTLLVILLILALISCSAPRNEQGNAVKSEAEEASLIPLQFQEVNENYPMTLISPSDIKQVLKEDSPYADGCKYVVFEKAGDSENLYLGVNPDNLIYNLGKVSMFSNGQPLKIVEIKPVKLANTDVVEINGIMGANYAPTTYISVQSGKPVILLKTEGPTSIKDLNKDGTEELISSYGTAAQTDLYVYKDNKFYKANLNAALSAEAVYLKDGVFESFHAEGKELKHYEYTAKGLLEIK